MVDGTWSCKAGQKVKVTRTSPKYADKMKRIYKIKVTYPRGSPLDFFGINRRNIEKMLKKHKCSKISK